MSKKKSKYYCINKKCKWHDPDNFTGCTDLNWKGTKKCNKRVNPEQYSCEVCGRDKNVKYYHGEWLCQYCRATESRHRNFAKKHNPFM
jgi:hypothetical protein